MYKCMCVWICACSSPCVCDCAHIVMYVCLYLCTFAPMYMCLCKWYVWHLDQVLQPGRYQTLKGAGHIHWCCYTWLKDKRWQLTVTLEATRVCVLVRVYIQRTCTLMCMCVCMHVYTHMWINPDAQLQCLKSCVWEGTLVCVNMHVHMYTLYIHIHIYICFCLCVCMGVHVNTQI